MRVSTVNLRHCGRWVLLAILVFGYSGQIVWAHGGGVPQLSNAKAGPYWVSVWTQPDPLRADEVHFTVAVSEPAPAGASIREAGPPVLEATVELRLTPVESNGERLVVPATHETAINKLFYEADVDLPTDGRWQIAILVEGPAGPGSAGFEIEVLPPAQFNWMWGAGLGLVLLVVAWVIKRSGLTTE